MDALTDIQKTRYVETRARIRRTIKAQASEMAKREGLTYAEAYSRIVGCATSPELAGADSALCAQPQNSEESEGAKDEQ